jgi:UrcA family protein
VFGWVSATGTEGKRKDGDMTRSILLGAVAFAAVAAVPSLPAQAQGAYDSTIVIEGPRVERRGGDRVMTSSSLVYYDDLRLDTEFGRDQLRARVKDAARETCDMLEDAYPGSPSISAERRCVLNAVRGANTQVAAAIARYYYG